MAFPLEPLFITNDQITLAAHDYQFTGLGTNQTDIRAELDGAGLFDFDHVPFGPPGGGAADVEGTHGQLGAGLADGLGGDDTDGFADFNRMSVGKVTAVAFGANASTAAAGEHGPDEAAVDTCVVHLVQRVFVDLFVGRHDHFIVVRIDDVFLGDPADNAFPEGLDNLTGFTQSFHMNAVKGAAVDFRNDGILGNVHQTPGQVTGVGGFEGGIGQTLACTVSGDEILENGQPLTEVRRNGLFDNFTGRLGHQAAHSGKLAHLVLAAAGAGFGHHVDGVETGSAVAVFGLVVGLGVGGNFLHHLLGDFVGGAGPDVDHLVVFFTLGDQTVVVLALNFLDLAVGRLDDLLFPTSG